MSDSTASESSTATPVNRTRKFSEEPACSSLQDFKNLAKRQKESALRQFTRTKQTCDSLGKLIDFVESKRGVYGPQDPKESLGVFMETSHEDIWMDDHYFTGKGGIEKFFGKFFKDKTVFAKVFGDVDGHSNSLSVLVILCYLVDATQELKAAWTKFVDSLFLEDFPSEQSEVDSDQALCEFESLLNKTPFGVACAADQFE